MSRKAKPKGVGSADILEPEPTPIAPAECLRDVTKTFPAVPEPPDPADEDNRVLRLAGLTSGYPEFKLPVNPRRFRDPDVDQTNFECRPLVLEIFRRAVADWRTAQFLYERADRKYQASEAAGPGAPDDSELDEWLAWVSVATTFMNDAEERVIAVVLMIHGLIEEPIRVQDLRKPWTPVVCELDGHFYIVSPSDEEYPDPVLAVTRVECFDDSQWGNSTW